MAGQLRAGQLLRCLEGAVAIDSIEATPGSEAYNLVVGDCGTYFVGERAVLVHDNTPLLEWAGAVPGLASVPR
jgi:hypothetical protein